MVNYLITFKYDFSEFEYDEDVNVEIVWFECDEFEKEFNSIKDVKEFEEWYNEGNVEEQVDIVDIVFKTDEEKGYITVTLENELKNEKDFANEIVDYVFEADPPTICVNFSGSAYYMDWNGYGPVERKQSFDQDEMFTIDKYTDVEIKKL